MAAAFQDTGLNAAGSVGDFIGGYVGQHQVVQLAGIAAASGGQQHPGCQDTLAGQSETQVTRLLSMDRRRCGDHLTDQVVGQQGHP